MAQACETFLLETFPQIENVKLDAFDRGLTAAKKRKKEVVVDILISVACRLWVKKVAFELGQDTFEVPQMTNVTPRDIMDDMAYVKKINPNIKMIVANPDDDPAEIVDRIKQSGQ